MGILDRVRQNSRLINTCVHDGINMVSRISSKVDFVHI